MASHGPGLARLSVAVVLAVAAPARADEPHKVVELVWTQNDPSCLSARELARTVESTLDRPVFRPRPTPFAKVIGTVGRAGPGRFEARIELRREDGALLAPERVLSTTRDCRRLNDDVAVVVTVMLDDLDKLPEPPPTSEERQLPAQLPLELKVTPPPKVEAPPPKRPSISFTLGAGAGLSSSLLPRVVGTVAVRGELAVGGFVPMAATLRAHAPSSAVTGGVGGTFAAWTGELSVCPAWPISRIRLGGCAGIGAGEIFLVHAVQGDTSLNQARARPMVLAALLPALAVHVAGPFWVRAEAGAWIPLLRETWEVDRRRGNVSDSHEEVFRPAVVVPVVGLTLEVKLRDGSAKPTPAKAAKMGS